jgi:deazaflavin-dependent oxidoreductase (nitroreductase family)
MKVFNALLIPLYRLSRGRIGSKLSWINVLLLTTTGRRTGKKRTIPIGYIKYEENFVVLTGDTVKKTEPDWLYNLRSNPRVEIEVKDRRLDAIGLLVDRDDRVSFFEKLAEVEPRILSGQNRLHAQEIIIVIFQPDDKSNLRL